MIHILANILMWVAGCKHDNQELSRKYLKTRYSECYNSYLLNEKMIQNVDGVGISCLRQ
jgi:hypothetical protein